ncbi:hypothetical protein CBS101457_006842 [Exobasidium rhododendri]|nr:hypothetical protein CBS101457_006842 [Exobasidium rhododendri]
MSALRPLIAPLTGTAVAAVVLYSMGTTLSTRTHQLSNSLHFSSRSLRRLAEVDDTEDLLSRANVAPDTVTLASSWEAKLESEKDKLRAAYTTPTRPSLREEIKARWNITPSMRPLQPSPKPTLR